MIELFSYPSFYKLLMATEVKSEKVKAVESTKTEPTETTTTSTQAPKKSNKTLWIILGIVAVLLVCAISCVLLVVFVLIPTFKASTSNTTGTTTVTPTMSSQLTITPSTSTSSSLDELLSTREPNELFPTTFSGENIRSIDDTDHLVGPITSNYEGESGSAEIRAGYYAFYGTETGQTIIAEKTVKISAIKLLDDSETTKASDLTEDVFANSYSSSDLVNLNLNNDVKYWAAYKEVTQAQAADHISGDARILLPNTNLLILINVWGGYTESQFITVVQNYVKALENTSTLYVLTDAVLPAE